jgi:drug/metabolite transporter (DMT)-like permease
VITLLAEALLLGVRLAPAKLGGAALILLGVLATQIDGQPPVVPPSGAAG